MSESGEKKEEGRRAKEEEQVVKERAARTTTLKVRTTHKTVWEANTLICFVQDLFLGAQPESHPSLTPSPRLLRFPESAQRKHRHLVLLFFPPPPTPHKKKKKTRTSAGCQTKSLLN